MKEYAIILFAFAMLVYFLRRLTTNSRLRNITSKKLVGRNFSLRLTYNTLLYTGTNRNSQMAGEHQKLGSILKGKFLGAGANIKNWVVISKICEGHRRIQKDGYLLDIGIFYYDEKERVWKIHACVYSDKDSVYPLFWIRMVSHRSLDKAANILLCKIAKELPENTEIAKATSTANLCLC